MLFLIFCCFIVKKTYSFLFHCSHCSLLFSLSNNNKELNEVKDCELKFLIHFTSFNDPILFLSSLSWRFDSILLRPSVIKFGLLDTNSISSFDFANVLFPNKESIFNVLSFLLLLWALGCFIPSSIKVDSFELNLSLISNKKLSKNLIENEV